MACFCLSEPFYSKPIVIELRALRRAMVFCLELGFTVAQFEGDAQIVVTALNNETESLAWYGHLVEEAKLIFQQQNHWSLSFVH